MTTWFNNNNNWLNDYNMVYNGGMVNTSKMQN